MDAKQVGLDARQVKLLDAMSGHSQKARKENKEVDYRVRAHGAAGVCNLTVQVTPSALLEAAKAWLGMGGYVVFLPAEEGSCSWQVEFPRDVLMEKNQ